MTRSPLLIALVGAPLLLVACYGPPPRAEDDGGDDGGDDACELPTQGNQAPGYPYDVETFRTDVLPVLAVSCGAVGCHGDPVGSGNFTLWADALQDDCSFAQTFSQVAAQIDLASPTDSRLLQAPSGGSTTHPRVLEATAPGYAALKLYIDDAVLRGGSGGGGGGGVPGGDDPHDGQVFTTVIQPMLDDYGCSRVGCHGSGAGGFTFVANATGADLEANFDAVTQRNDLDDPTQSRVYVKGVSSHSGSEELSAGDVRKFLDWVTAAADQAP